MATSTSTSAECVTRVRADDDDRLCAQCLACGVTFVALDDHDVAASLAAFDRMHPGTGGRHSRGRPRGWRPAPTPSPRGVPA